MKRGIGPSDVCVLMMSYGVVEEAGGPGVAAAGFAAGLARLGFSVNLVALDWPGKTWLTDADRASSQGYELHLVSAGTWPQRVLRMATLATAASTRSRRSRTILWANGIWGEQTVATALVARRLGSRSVVRPAGSLGVAALRYRSLKKALYYRAVESRILHAAAGIHCMSHREVEELPADLRGRAFTVPSGVDVSHAEIETRGPPFTIGVLARLHPIKRQHLVLQVLERLVERGHDLHLEFAGSTSDPAYEEALRRTVERSPGLRTRVRFLGHIAQADLQAAVGSWRAAALLSEQENFGHAIVTAAALGVPTVATPGVALAADLELAGAGRMAPPQDVERALIEVVGEHNPRYRVAARQFAQRFSWDASASALADKLLEIASGPGT